MKNRQDDRILETFKIDLRVRVDVFKDERYNEYFAEVEQVIGKHGAILQGMGKSISDAKKDLFKQLERHIK